MDVFEAISKRRSIRRYKDTPVEEYKLDKILNSARIAPSRQQAGMEILGGEG